MVPLVFLTRTVYLETATMDSAVSFSNSLYMLISLLNGIILVYVYIYVCKCHAIVSATSYYSANSVNVCDAEKRKCKCSESAERCTGLDVCSDNGECEGNHKNLFH